MHNHIIELVAANTTETAANTYDDDLKTIISAQKEDDVTGSHDSYRHKGIYLVYVYTIPIFDVIIDVVDDLSHPLMID